MSSIHSTEDDEGITPIMTGRRALKALKVNVYYVLQRRKLFTYYTFNKKFLIPKPK